MTKRQALLKLRTSKGFRLCMQDDYLRLVRHLQLHAQYVGIHVEGYDKDINALNHNGWYYIPVNDESLSNCNYDPSRAK